MVGDVNLREGVWYESIFSAFITSNPYFTPLGFRVSQRTIELKIYRTTKVSLLIDLLDKAALNVVDDPYLYYLATFKEETGGIPQSEISFLNGIPVLKKAYGYILMKKRGLVKHENTYHASFEIEEIVENPLIPEILEPYSRCRVFLIEMIIYASKIKAMRETLDSDLLNKLKRQVEDSYKIVEKTCFNEKDLKLANELKEMVARWLKR